MPELPDVEATRLHLLPLLSGQRIAEVILRWPGIVAAPSADGLRAGLAGRRILDIGRRAKYLLLPLDNGRTLVVHLGMTGTPRVAEAGDPPHRFAHTILRLESGRELRLIDPRKLASLWLVDDPEAVVGRLGPEPLADGFTPRRLGERLAGRRAPTKAVLMDQEAIAGLGNIYADEVLHAARVHPLRPARDLTAAEVRRLHAAIRRVLADATRRLAALMPLDGPPSESPEGSQVLRLPRQAGAPCPACGWPIRRLVLRGRSTYLCLRCQRQKGTG